MQSYIITYTRIFQTLSISTPTKTIPCRYFLPSGGSTMDVSGSINYGLTHCKRCGRNWNALFPHGTVKDSDLSHEVEEDLQRLGLTTMGIILMLT